MSQPPKKNAFVIHAFKQQPPKDTDMPVSCLVIQLYTG